MKGARRQSSPPVFFTIIEGQLASKSDQFCFVSRRWLLRRLPRTRTKDLSSASLNHISHNGTKRHIHEYNCASVSKRARNAAHKQTDLSESRLLSKRTNICNEPEVKLRDCRTQLLLLPPAQVHLRHVFELTATAAGRLKGGLEAG